MAFTVKQLSEISGVTIRALHYYEEIDLLKPTYYGSNGYRYYEEKELLTLQQILFFKKLGFTLQQIRKVIGTSNFDQIAALQSHRKALCREWEKVGSLLRTIDKTIKHLKGTKKMKDREFFEGFSLVEKANLNEPYFAQEEIVLQNLRNQSSILDESEKLQVAKEANQIYSRIADCLDKGMAPSSKAVQKIVKEHFEFSGKFYEMSKDVYTALIKLNAEHPAYRKQLDPIHPDLAIFMTEAMKFFADEKF